MNLDETIRWLKYGRQKRLIVQVLRKPMTAKEIMTAARQVNPRLQLRDLWFLLPQLIRRNVVQCLTPDELNSKLYCLTDFGRFAAEMGFGIVVEGTVEGIDWHKYSWVVRGRRRPFVLEELGRHRLGEEKAKTISRVRKHLNETVPMGIKSVRNVVLELQRARLVRCVGQIFTTQQKLYRITAEGERLLTQMRR